MQSNVKPAPFTARKASKGFTLIELLIVVTVIGILIAIAAPFLKNATIGATSKQLDDFAAGAASNWRWLNAKCGTSNDTSASLTVATPSVTNSLALMVVGSSYLAAAYQGCWDEASLAPLHTKATGNATDGFKIGGYPITWSGGSGTTSISFAVVGVPVEVVLPLYKQYSSATGANAATVLPGAGDATDPMIRFTAPAGGITTLTLLKP